MKSVELDLRCEITKNMRRGDELIVEHEGVTYRLHIEDIQPVRNEEHPLIITATRIYGLAVVDHKEAEDGAHTDHENTPARSDLGE